MLRVCNRKQNGTNLVCLIVFIGDNNSAYNIASLFVPFTGLSLKALRLASILNTSLNRAKPHRHYLSSQNTLLVEQ